jgi:hypothetical protein
MLLTRMLSAPSSRASPEGNGRADQNDRAASAAGADMRDSRLRGVPDTGEVDIDHIAPLVFGHLVGPPEVSDRSVRDHDVEPAELGDTQLERLLDGVEVTHVSLHGDDSAIQSFDLTDRLLQIVRPRHRERNRVYLSCDVDRNDVGTFAGQAHGMATALAPRGTGHERDFALDSSWHF